MEQMSDLQIIQIGEMANEIAVLRNEKERLLQIVERSGYAIKSHMADKKELQQRITELEQDARRYRLLRRNVTPRQLVENGLRDGGDLAPSESIEARIDWMVDDAMEGEG